MSGNIPTYRWVRYWCLDCHAVVDTPSITGWREPVYNVYGQEVAYASKQGLVCPVCFGAIRCNVMLKDGEVCDGARADTV